jgi:signal transduction histidine kinase
MNERRRRWKINFTIQIFNLALIGTTLLFLIVFYALWKVVTELQYSITWQIYLIILQISLVGFFLILLIITFVVLHRTLGPIPRMEKILEKIINGDYSLRINVRKKDLIRPFVDKLNRVLELLEEKAKS